MKFAIFATIALAWTGSAYADNVLANSAHAADSKLVRRCAGIIGPVVVVTEPGVKGSFSCEWTATAPLGKQRSICNLLCNPL